MNRSRLPLFTTILLLVFFYLPILLLVINSFNTSRFSTSWNGFTFKWYVRLFEDRAIWSALTNTMIIALGSTLTAMVLGTISALALHRYNGRLQRIHYTLIYTPLVVPDILMGISLLLFFVAIGFQLSLMTIYLAHVTFCVSYVAMVVLARLQDFDFSVIEASQDLGANWWQTTWRVLVPMLAPGIIAGGLLAFTLSIDDFVITFFVSGPGSTTLPVHIYGMIKRSRNLPIINALSTLLLVITFFAVWSSQRLTKEQKT
jgi:spermidine/putrescine transport system permease protein